MTPPGPAIQEPVKNEQDIAPAAMPPHEALVDRLGKWAYAHRDQARTYGGELKYRNALASVIAWVPTIASFAVTRAAWTKYETFAAKHTDALFTKVAKPLLSKEFPTGRMIGFIFGGWFTYRTTTRMYHRAYDRLFGAKNAEEAAERVRDMPKNAVEDFKQILPAGLAEVAIGAPVLAGVKAALVPGKNFIAVGKGQWDIAKKGYVNDWLATGIAYSAFTEVCDHIYPSVNPGQDNHNFYQRLKGEKERQETPKDQKKFGFFTEDGVGRMAFRTTGSVLLGFAAYFAGQRAMKAAVGVPTQIEHTLSGITKNFAKDYIAWVPFTLYTVIAQVYRDSYDGLFRKMENKSSGRSV